MIPLKNQEYSYWCHRAQIYSERNRIAYRIGFNLTFASSLVCLCLCRPKKNQVVRTSLHLTEDRKIKESQKV